ncbi:MAG: NADH:flavin oxidoreductase [Gammaproteobacteria bacterium]|jgi:2,4-dienoyl-CoA reductase-like NADH-dependent reductase (Old Yellow Enzyme family)|nr:MAG: NADH:flavin oxidoreductase [Gammaproteobacteria bacterium]
MTDLFEPLSFSRGPDMKNRFMLAPLTNSQSHADGVLSDDEARWLTMRAEGGFGLTMTCAAHVQAVGQGFPGQLGVFGDEHLPGLTGLADSIRTNGSLSAVQLHHAGMRSPRELIGEDPVCPSVNEEFGARALHSEEVSVLIEDFVAAAARAETAGFDGVELHGAHGYILCQFLSGEINRRDDEFGGSLENRARPLTDIIAGIRARCGADFQLGVRLSPERFGVNTLEIRDLAQALMRSGDLDYIDMSLWDVQKEPVEDDLKGRTLMSYFTELDRGECRLGVAGKVYSAKAARWCMEEGCDFVLAGRAAILHHDFPQKVAADPEFVMASLPVTEAHLKAEGLGDAFVGYMKGWKGFVAEEA